MSQKKKPAPAKKAVPVQEPPKPIAIHAKPAIKEKRQAQAKSPDVPREPDFFDTLGSKAPWVALGLIVLIGCWVFRDFLFGDKLYFYKDIGSDTLNYSYPYAHTVAQYIARNGIPKWSFNFGIGQNLFPFFLRDPFDIILYLAGANHFAGAEIYKELIKIFLAGFAFYHYLKILKLSEYACMIGGILFAYSGFMIVGSGWYIFSFEGLNMVLMLLGFELLFQRNKWFLFLLAIYLMCISQPFNLFPYGIFFVCYVFFRHIQEGVFTWKNIGIITLKIAGLGVLAILLSGPFMLENVVQLLESPRGSGNTSYANMFMNAPMFTRAEPMDFGIDVSRFFSSDLLGSGNEFIKGLPSNSNTLEAPMFYCGLPCLLLMPQVFQFLTRKVKIAFIVVILLWLLPIEFPYFRWALWLFTGNYYRGYSIMVAFFLIYYSLFALDLIVAKRKLNWIVLLVTLACLFGLLNYHYFPDKEQINEMLHASPGMIGYVDHDPDVVKGGVYAFVSVMLLVYAGLLYYMARPGSPLYVKYVFMGLLVFELAYLAGISVNDRYVQLPPRNEVVAAPLSAEDLKSKERGYNDYTVDAVNFIKQIDHSFYRIDKVYGSSPAMHYSINDGMAQDYYGTSGYSPFNEITYIQFLQLTGISRKDNELQSRWAVGMAYRPILESENQVKYLLSKGPISYISRNSCDSLGTFGNVRVYRNKYVLPFGYTYNRFIPESVYNRFSPDQKDFVSLKTAVVTDSQLSRLTSIRQFQLQDTVTVFNFNLYKDYTDSLKMDTLTLTKFSETDIEGKIDLPEDKIMYLSIPYDKGWTLTVDGKEQDKLVLTAGMTGVLLKKGAHTVQMSYELRYFRQGVYLSIAGLVILAALIAFMKMKKRPGLPPAAATAGETA